MTSYANPNEYTAKLNTVYPLEERIKQFKEVPEVVIHRIQAFHGWGGRTTDDTYYVTSNGELRHNQIDVKMLGGTPISDLSKDTVVKRNPQIASITGAIISGTYGLLALAFGDADISEIPWAGYATAEFLMISIGYMMPMLIRNRPGDSDAWKNYQTYLKGARKVSE